MDFDAVIDATSRTVEVGTESDPHVRTLTVTRLFDISSDSLWNASTRANELTRWFLPISGTLYEGGRYEIQDTASGLIRECRPKTFVSATWEYGPDTSWLELRFVPRNSQTELTFKHIAHVTVSQWTQFGPGALGIFWDLAFMRLADYLAGALQHDRSDMMSWAVSIEGYKFMLLSSQAWCAANISAGADPAWAQQAADRAMTAYQL
jgi:uncharacterized protein YndB with AHSA1/START domain